MPIKTKLNKKSQKSLLIFDMYPQQPTYTIHAKLISPMTHPLSTTWILQDVVHLSLWVLQCIVCLRFSVMIMILFNDDDDHIDDQHQYELPNATHWTCKLFSVLIRMCVAVGTTCIVETNYTYIYQWHSKYENLMNYTTNPKLSHFVTIFYSKFFFF